MEKIKLINKKTKVVKLIDKNISSDYLTTKEWQILKDEKKYEIPKNEFKKIDKEEK